MRAGEFVVEVRDRDLRRVGQIETELLDVRATLRDMEPGEWTLRLPSSHRLAPALRAKGSGIIATHVDPTIGVLWSGPGHVSEGSSQEDPIGTLTATGTTDDVLLWNRRAYPTPTAPIGSQGGYDVRAGTAEAVMGGYVNANLGPAARAERQVAGLTVAIDQGRGGLVSRQARFDVLGDLLRGIAVPAGLAFRLVQVGSRLEFQVIEPRDRTGTVRLDVRNGTLASQSAAVRPPSLTHAIVAGQGNLGARTLVEVAAPEASAAWGPWGRVETYLDQRQTDDPAELEQAGVKALLDAQGEVAATAVPAESLSMAWPTKWNTGDRIAIIVAGRELPATVTSVSLIADSSGVKVGAGIGDPEVPSLDTTGMRRQLRSLQERLDALERLTGAATVDEANP